MSLRRTVVAALLAAGIAVPAVSSAGVALAQPGGWAAAVQRAIPKETRPAKTRKPVRTPFTATGKVVAVDPAGGTLTVRARGGTKDVRNHTVTVTVTDGTRLANGGKPIALAAVVVGAKVTVTGVRRGDVYTAARVRVTRRPVVKPSPSPSVKPSPSVEPSPEVEPSESGEPTPGTEPADDPSPEDDPGGDDPGGDDPDAEATA